MLVSSVTGDGGKNIYILKEECKVSEFIQCPSTKKFMPHCIFE